MNAGHFGPHVTDRVADLISHRGAHHARELNKAFAIAEAHSVARGEFVHGAAVVAEVASRYPQALADHHYGEKAR